MVKKGKRLKHEQEGSKQPARTGEIQSFNGKANANYPPGLSFLCTFAQKLVYEEVGGKPKEKMWCNLKKDRDREETTGSRSSQEGRTSTGWGNLLGAH